MDIDAMSRDELVVALRALRQLHREDAQRSSEGLLGAAELRLARERLELALRGADLAAWDWNVETGEVIFTPRWAEMRGIPPEELAPHVDSWRDAVHPDDRAAVQKALLDHFEGRTAEYETEHRSRTRSGEWIWVLDRGRVCERDTQGRPIRMAGTALDISARKRAEEALRKSEEKWRTLFDILPVGVAILDADRRVVDENRALEEIAKLTPEALAAGAYRKRRYLSADETPMAPEDLPSVRAMREQRVVGPVEIAIVKEDGSTTWTEVRAAPMPFPDAACAVVTLDINERVAAEAELTRLHRKEERLRSGFEGLDRASSALNEVLARKDVTVESFFQVIVDQAAALVGAELAALGVLDDTGASFAKWVHHGMDPALARALGRSPLPVGVRGEVMRIGVPIHIAGRAVGNLYLANKRAGEEFTEEDERFVALLALRASKVLEIAHLSEQVRAAVRAREDLLAVVSHDLRSPLSAIRAYAQMLLRAPATGERRQGARQLQSLLRAAQSMGRLIDDLLEAATIEAGTLRVTPRPEEALAIVEEAVEIARPLATVRLIQLDNQVPAGLPPIAADRQRLGQVLSNLLGNAVKFTPDGGLVQVRAGAEDDHVHFVVSDSGPGMTEEQVRHAFERYWKGDESRSVGVGLGLFIARGIVEAHAGRIWVESHVGAGTAVHFTVPLAGMREAHALPTPG